MVEQLLQSIGVKSIAVREDAEIKGFKTFTYNNDKKRGRAKKLWIAGAINGIPHILFDKRILADEYCSMIYRAESVLSKLISQNYILVALGGRFFLDHADCFTEKGNVKEILFLEEPKGMDADEVRKVIEEELNPPQNKYQERG